MDHAQYTILFYMQEPSYADDELKDVLIKIIIIIENKIDIIIM